MRLIQHLSLGVVLASPATALGKKAADPCKDATVETDKFTGQTVVTADPIPLNMAKGLGLALEHTDESTELRMTIIERGVVDQGVDAGAPVPFLFDEVVTLTTTRSVAANASTSGSVIYTKRIFVFALSEQQLQVMSDQDLQTIRIPLVTQEYDWELSSKMQKDTRAAAACVLTYLPSV